MKGKILLLNPLSLVGESSIPQDASAVLIIAPETEYTDRELALLREYIEKGGSTVMLSEAGKSSTIPTIASYFGIQVGNNVVLDKMVRSVGGPTVGVQPEIKSFREHPITKDFNKSIILTTANSVTASDQIPQTIKIVEFAYTTGESWAESKMDLVFSEDPHARLEEDDIKGPVSVAIAATTSLKDTTQPGKIVIIGDSDFVSNVSIRQLFNRDFFLNTLNWVLGSTSAISIRAKSLRASTVQLTRAQLESVFLICAILVPELLLSLGLFSWWKRSTT